MNAIGSYLEHLKVLRRHYVESDLRDGSGNRVCPGKPLRHPKKLFITAKVLGVKAVVVLLPTAAVDDNKVAFPDKE